MYINWHLREIQIKIVYYGPALSGKTTNLEKIHQRVPDRNRSNLVSLKTQEDRTLFFDFLQLDLGKISGLTPKLQLYTVPGQSYYESSRRIVLRGADGIVFVVDSDPLRARYNLNAWHNMQKHLQSFQRTLDDVAVVVQFNKQDLPNAVAPSVYSPLLGLHRYPFFKAVAIDGVGVFETLKAITQGVLAKIRDNTSQTSIHPSPHSTSETTNHESAKSIHNRVVSTE